MGIWNGCLDVSCYTWSQQACAVYLVEQEVVICSTSAEYAVWEKLLMKILYKLFCISSAT